MKWACVARLGSIGDNLIVSSVFPLIKRQGYMLEVMAQEPSYEVFVNNPFIDKLTVLKKDNLPNNNQDWQQYFVKRAQEYDKFYHLSHSIESHVAFHPDSTWFHWPASYRRKLADKSYLALTHDICEVAHEYDPRFFPTDQEVAKAKETMIKINPLAHKVIGWVITGSRLDKLYPYSAMVIGRLIKELGVEIFMFGNATGPEHEMAKAIQEHVKLLNSSTGGLHLGMSAADAGISWPLRRSISTLQQCDLVIGPDTGLMWGVASCGMPKMVLLGHASAKNICEGWIDTVAMHANRERVPCYSCHRLHNDASTCVPNKENNGAACISDISVQCILMTAKTLLFGTIQERALLPVKYRGNITLPEILARTGT